MSEQLQRFEQDLIVLKQRKEESIQQFNQLVGAISVMEQIIDRMKSDELEIVVDPQIEGNIIEGIPSAE